jgi:hypothetical protein
MMDLPDWRKEGISSFVAFFTRRLRHNDYHILLSLIGAVISLVVMAVLISIREKSVIGVTISVPILHYMMAIFSFMRVLNTVEAFSVWQTACFFLSYGV